MMKNPQHQETFTVNGVVATTAGEFLTAQPKPTNFEHWCWQAMVASYKPSDFTIWGDILEYIGWLDSLITTIEPLH